MENERFCEILILNLEFLIKKQIRQGRSHIIEDMRKNISNFHGININSPDFELYKNTILAKVSTDEIEEFMLRIIEMINVSAEEHNKENINLLTSSVKDFAKGLVESVDEEKKDLNKHGRKIIHGFRKE